MPLPPPVPALLLDLVLAILRNSPPRPRPLASQTAREALDGFAFPETPEHPITVEFATEIDSGEGDGGEEEGSLLASKDTIRAAAAAAQMGVSHTQGPDSEGGGGGGSRWRGSPAGAALVDSVRVQGAASSEQLAEAEALDQSEPSDVAAWTSSVGPGI